jgi:TetR/AcrR family transcriptional regulator, regulator of cefoperazone and chloramphenicol sensitivity
MHRSTLAAMARLALPTSSRYLFDRTNRMRRLVQQKLLDTAIDHFGRMGFEGASTRAIARDSATAMSSITYHFGGKQGLYVAAAAHIAACITELQGPVLAAARDAGQASPSAATEAVLAILDSFAAMMLRPETEGWARFIIREQQFPTEAFDRLYAGAMQGIVETVSGLLHRARPDLSREQVLATGLLLFGQALILRSGRASVCRVFGTDQIDDATQALLRARLRAHTLCILSETP